MGVLFNAVAPGPTGSTGEPMTAAEVAAENAAYPLGLGGPPRRAIEIGRRDRSSRRCPNLHIA
jgi:hypothetical protein